MFLRVFFVSIQRVVVGNVWDFLTKPSSRASFFFFFRVAFGAKMETTGHWWMDPEDVKMDPEDVNFLLNMRIVLVAIASYGLFTPRLTCMICELLHDL